MEKNLLARIFEIAPAVEHILAHAVEKRDFELIDAVFEQVTLGAIEKMEGLGGGMFNSGPAGPLATAVKVGDLEMVRYLHAKGLAAPVSRMEDVEITPGGRQIMSYRSDVIGLAIGNGHDDVAVELIFKHPKHTKHFAAAASMSATITGVGKEAKSRRGNGRENPLDGVTPLQCALRMEMPNLARAALDHMDVTLEGDLIEAVAADSDLADEIASKCTVITLSNPSFAESAKDLTVQQKERLADLVVRNNLGIRFIESTSWSDRDKAKIDTKPFIDGFPLKLMQHVLDHPGFAQWRTEAVEHAAWAAVNLDRLDAARWLGEEMGLAEKVTHHLSDVKSKEMARELMRLGADVDQPAVGSSYDGYSAMQKAVEYGNEAKMRFWAELGSDLSQRTRRKDGGPGKTLMQIAKDDKTKKLLRQLKVEQSVGHAMADAGDDDRPPTKVSTSGPSPL